jgi:hypothetical protein
VGGCNRKVNLVGEQNKERERGEREGERESEREGGERERERERERLKRQRVCGNVRLRASQLLP